MTLSIVPMSEAEVAAAGALADSGLGALTTPRGNLPLERMDAAVSLTGLVARTVLTQGFRNPYDQPLEATYIFPLPDRAAVTAMRFTADDRVVDAELRERGEARQRYDEAVAQGRQAAIAEQERADVFTMRVGNILPGQQVSVTLTLVGPLSYADSEATYRLPLVVAPRYIPGAPLDGEGVGSGRAVDTDAVPDASRITPPVLLPGFPNPVALSIEVAVDGAGLPLGGVRCSLPTASGEDGRLRVVPGERLNRDFILRLPYGSDDEAASLVSQADGAGDTAEGTFQLTVLAPASAMPPRPRDVVLLLDRSGSMGGWKMVAARRAAARIIDTLGDADQFAVLTFDTVVEHPDELGPGLVAGTDRNRFRAVRHLAAVDARGGTELLEPLRQALRLLAPPADANPPAAPRDRVIVLVTDGQVGNEDQILAATSDALAAVRVHTVGIDQAVNAGFLGRLAAVGGGRAELVESEDRLDDAMERIHRRIAAPAVSGIELVVDGVEVIAGSLTPARLPSLYVGAPLVVSGRYRGTGMPRATLTGQLRDGSSWSAAVAGRAASDAAAITPLWARAHLADLADAYAARGGDTAAITATSLRFGVLCAFTAWVAVDTRVVTDGDGPHRVTQPVEWPAGWVEPAMPLSAAPVTAAPMMMVARASVAYDAAAPAPMAAPPAGASMPAPSAAYRAAPGKARGGFSFPRPSLRAKAAGPDPTPVREGALSEAREQCAREIATLRAALEPATALGPIELRELLEDLASRLDALLRHVGGRLDPTVLAPLRTLAARLTAHLGAARPSTGTGGDRELATAALREFEAFVGGAPGQRG